MKRFVFLVMMVAAVMFSLSIAPCEAKDVWVDRWQNTCLGREPERQILQGYHKRGAERKSETLHQMEICKTWTGNVAL